MTSKIMEGGIDGMKGSNLAYSDIVIIGILQYSVLLYVSKNEMVS